MNEAHEVFGSNYDDCAGLARVIMSSCSETLLQNTNDGVRTNFGCYEPFFYDRIHPSERQEFPSLSPVNHQAYHRARSK